MRERERDNCHGGQADYCFSHCRLLASYVSWFTPFAGFTSFARFNEFAVS
jgi:hypothetical protein